MDQPTLLWITLYNGVKYRAIGGQYCSVSFNLTIFTGQGDISEDPCIPHTVKHPFYTASKVSRLEQDLFCHHYVRNEDQKQALQKKLDVLEPFANVLGRSNSVEQACFTGSEQTLTNTLCV